MDFIVKRESNEEWPSNDVIKREMLSPSLPRTLGSIQKVPSMSDLSEDNSLGK